MIYNTLCTTCTRHKNAFKNIIRLALSANLFSLLNYKLVIISNVTPLEGSLLFWKNPHELRLKGINLLLQLLNLSPNLLFLRSPRSL